MDLQLVLMTIIAFSAVVAVFSYAVNLLLKPVYERLGRLEKDVESLKAGQARLEAMLAELLSRQAPSS